MRIGRVDGKTKHVRCRLRSRAALRRRRKRLEVEQFGPWKTFEVYGLDDIAALLLVGVRIANGPGQTENATGVLHIIATEQVAERHVRAAQRLAVVTTRGS